MSLLSAWIGSELTDIQIQNQHKFRCTTADLANVTADLQCGNKRRNRIETSDSETSDSELVL